MSDETLLVVSKILGNTVKTLEKVLYVMYGYRHFDQLDDEE